LRAAPYVSRAHERDDRNASRYLALASLARDALCDSGHADVWLGKRSERRALGPTGRPAGYARAPTPPAFLGLERRDAAVVPVVLSPRARPHSVLPRRVGEVSHQVSGRVSVITVCAGPRSAPAGAEGPPDARDPYERRAAASRAARDHRGRISVSGARDLRNGRMRRRRE